MREINLPSTYLPSLRGGIAGLTVLVLGACATAPATMPEQQTPAVEQESTEEWLVNGRKIPSWVSPYTHIERILKSVAEGKQGSTPFVKFGYGFVWDRLADLSMKSAAGIYGCSLYVISDGQGNFKTEGYVVENPKVMEKVLYDADTDKDGFVGVDEANTLLNRLVTEEVKCPDKGKK